MNDQTAKFTYEENIFSDFHKEAYGFRPRGHEFYSATPERKQEIWDQVGRDLDAAIEDERLRKEASTQRFENDILRMMDLGAQDRFQAIRWLIESLNPTKEDLMYGGDYMRYEFGLPYEYAVELDRVIKAGITTRDF